MNESDRISKGVLWYPGVKGYSYLNQIGSFKEQLHSIIQSAFLNALSPFWGIL